MTGLLAQHQADLRKSGITPEIAAAHHLQSLCDVKIIAEILGWDKGIKKLGSCLAFPYLNLQGQCIDHVRLKPDKPFRDKGGKTAKYLGPRGKTSRVYFPLGVAAALDHPEIPLIITEGEKKAICAQQHGFPCLGLAGVECWSKPRPVNEQGNKIGPRLLIDDLANIAWKSRLVYLAFDSDRIRKKEVQRAESALAECLRAEGTLIKVVTIPDGPPGSDGKPTKLGLDDFLVAHGADALRKLLDSASSPEPLTSAERNEGGFCNFYVVEDEEENQEDGENKKKIFGKPAPVLCRELLEATCGWPKRVGNVLFALKDYQPIYFETSSELIAWASTTVPRRCSEPKANPVIWGRGSDLLTQEQFHAALRQYVEPFEAMALYPHEPALPGFYYAHPPLTGGNGSALFGLLNRFSPASAHDADLILAFFLSFVSGVPFGQRPAWLIASDDADEEAGRGVGKTTLVRMAAKLVGGEISYSANESLPEFAKRILSPEGRDKRIVLIDNVKSHKFSSADLESLITTGTISGRQLFVGEGRIPNVFCWCLTINGASMSKDMAKRVITCKLKRPVYQGDWEGETLTYIEKHRWAILGDLVARLRRSIGNMEEFTRWGTWEKQVLTKLHDPLGCQRLIRERQLEIDDDEEDKHLVRDAVMEFLRSKAINPDQEVVRFRSQDLARIVNGSLNESRPVNKVSAFVKSLGIKELRRSNRASARGWVWRGEQADPQVTARPVSGW